MSNSEKADSDAVIPGDGDKKESRTKKDRGGKPRGGEAMSGNKMLVLCTALMLLLFLGVIFGPQAFSSFNEFRANAMAAAAKTAEKAAPEPILPPLLKEADMVGSVWNVKIKGFVLKVSFAADGNAVASSDSIIVRQLAKAKYGVESLPGKWRIEGPKLIVSTTFEGKEVKTDLTISGTKLISKEGAEVVRVK